MSSTSEPVLTFSVLGAKLFLILMGNDFLPLCIKIDFSIYILMLANVVAVPAFSW